ncbi:MAG: hypothetical protein ACYCSS_14955 [Sulfuriferula sp.]
MNLTEAEIRERLSDAISDVVCLRDALDAAERNMRHWRDRLADATAAVRLADEADEINAAHWDWLEDE